MPASHGKAGWTRPSKFIGVPAALEIPVRVGEAVKLLEDRGTGPTATPTSHPAARLGHTCRINPRESFVLSLEVDFAELFAAPLGLLMNVGRILRPFFELVVVNVEP